MNNPGSVHANEQEWHIESCTNPINFVLSDV